MSSKWSLIKFDFIDKFTGKEAEDFEVFEEGVEVDRDLVRWLHRHFPIRLLTSMTWWEAEYEDGSSEE